ncbi:uncharacterized protein SCHCODRAFT_02491826 [Schizophyllum commune H4-8]|nr:uncharacterized protein SCHCODRAFT_02491826 [Schizophyllum commune H4-8]KAI5896192.1 hypothetical protein SCHCODRAFT_02491826 [Schizophyllum commune H4-8]
MEIYLPNGGGDMPLHLKPIPSSPIVTRKSGSRARPRPYPSPSFQSGSRDGNSVADSLPNTLNPAQGGRFSTSGMAVTQASVVGQNASGDVDQTSHIPTHIDDDDGLIPAPPGEPGRPSSGGYSLQATLEDLGWTKKDIRYVRVRYTIGGMA